MRFPDTTRHNRTVPHPTPLHFTARHRTAASSLRSSAVRLFFRFRFRFRIRPPVPFLFPFPVRFPSQLFSFRIRFRCRIRTHIRSHTRSGFLFRFQCRIRFHSVLAPFHIPLPSLRLLPNPDPASGCTPRTRFPSTEQKREIFSRRPLEAARASDATWPPRWRPEQLRRLSHPPRLSHPRPCSSPPRPPPAPALPKRQR